MDPRLDTRGSNDLGGAMFKGEHARVLIQATLKQHYRSPAFLIRQKGEKESKSEDQAQEQAKTLPNLQGKVKTQATTKARLSSLCL